MPRTVRRYAQSSRLNRLHQAKSEAFTFWATTDTHIWEGVGEDPSATGADQGLKKFYSVPSKMRDFARQVEAAKPKPHLVMHCGDIVEIDGGFDYFYEQWETISVPTEVLPGNHDYSLPYTTTRMQAVADGLRFGGAPVVAGSRLNRTFVASGNGVTVRFIVVDVNVGRDATPVEPNGALTADQKTWIADTMAASGEDIMFICTHHGPHDYGFGWFVAADALDLQAMVIAETEARPRRRITAMFGHNHSVRFGCKRYNNLPGLPGLCIPVMLENLTSPFAKVHVFRDGTILTESGTVTYQPA